MLNVQEIKEIIKLIDQSSLNEFTYETNGTKMELKKQSNQVQSLVEPVIAQSDYVPKTVPTNITADAQATSTNEVNDRSEEGPKDAAAYDEEIKSPMVGTFYRASSPENDPYVSEGSRVSQDSIVCIVEAMKLFNEIESEVSGEVVEILVEDGELVEYGQPLFRVKN